MFSKKFHFVLILFLISCEKLSSSFSTKLVALIMKFEGNILLTESGLIFKAFA